jgi:hypothetical protein
MLKPMPLALAEVIVRFAVPEFVKVTFTVDVPPTATLPKFTLEGLKVTAP